MNYPRTISNGAKEELTFLRRVPGPGGERLEVENRVQPGGGPPLHVHFQQEEVITVRSGRLAWQIPGQEVRHAGPGETVTFAPGVAHRFWNAGSDELRCTGHIQPPHNFEYFLTEIYESTRRNGGGRPAGFDAAYLLTRYRSEFAMTEIPAFVQKHVFPLQIALGKLLGRHRRFKDAPPPLPAAG